MKKTTLLLLLTFTLLLTACSGTRSTGANSGFGAQGTASTGNLSPALQVAIGTLKLDKTSNEITKDQAAQLLPLWETMQVLESSDTAAAEEKSALVTQIQETMTQQQMQMITGMNLTRQDMFAALQSAGLSFGGQGGNTQRPSTTTGGGGNFGPGGGGFQGPPPDGGFGGGGGFFQGQRTQSNGTNQGNTNRTTTRQVNADPDRIPTPLIQAIVEYLKKKAGT
jgi:hypothetical protein